MHQLTHPKQLPSVDRVLQIDEFHNLSEQFGRDSVVTEVQRQLSQTRKELTSHKSGAVNASKHHTADTAEYLDYLFATVSNSLATELTPSIKRVLNLTGTILHTNLGRAPYPKAAIDAMIEISQGACNLEFDLHNGKRGRRDDHVENWICKLTGAEAATTVNNNAAAVLLTLNSLAKGKNVIVSRGELIEIGGSFRVPAIMKKAGCKLREVGTTNRTHLHDYEEAITKKTAALMKVHTSNYEINGFTKSIGSAQLAALAKEKDIPLIDDLGSGTLTDLTALGMPYERTARDALNDGADIITFSGDKLLGGPQCGIIAGRRDLISLIDQNPMKRAVRLDKVTLAALEAVLKLYSNPASLAQTVPSLGMLSRDVTDIKRTAISFKSMLDDLLSDFDISIIKCQSQIGSGALPTNTLDSHAVVVRENDTTSAATLAKKFRELPLPVIGRVANDAFWMDCRTLQQEAVDELSQILKLSSSTAEP